MEEQINNKNAKMGIGGFILRVIGVAVLVIACLGLSGLGIYSIENYISEKEKPLNYQDCSNLGLEDSANCLVDYVSTFYRYNVSDDTNKTLEELQKYGGDCYDYNKLYEKIGKELGFESYSFRIENTDMAHRFAVIMNDDGYCLLDQINKPMCSFFK